MTRETKKPGAPRGGNGRSDERDARYGRDNRNAGGRRDARAGCSRQADGRTGANAARECTAAEPALQQEGGADETPFLIIGRNAVREALRAGRSIDRLLVSSEPDGSLREIVSLARDRKLVIREVERKKLDELCMPFGHGGRTANHQGVVAYAAGMEYCTVEDLSLIHI